MASGPLQNLDSAVRVRPAPPFETEPGIRRVFLFRPALEGNHWEMVSGDTTILRPIGKPEFKPERAAVGAGGALTLRLEAASAGRTKLGLAYRRPWEKDVQPIETFEATVVVK